MPEETKSPQEKFATLISKYAEDAVKTRLSGKAGQEAAARVGMAFRAIAARTPDIYGCTPASVADCVIKSATYNLFPGGLMPDVDLIVVKPSSKDANGRWEKKPYGQWTLDWRPSYRGLRRLVHRETGIDLEPMCVLEGDEFKWVAGLNPDLVHIPNVDPEAMDDVTDENLRCAYVVWSDPETKAKKFIVMRKGDILRARSKSESWKYEDKRKSSPWFTDFHPMVLKTVVLWAIRRVIPFDPNQIAVMEGAITAADDAMPQEAPAPVETPAEVKTETKAHTSTAEALNAVLEQRTIPESHRLEETPEEVPFIPEKVAEKVVIEAKAEPVADAKKQAQEGVADKKRNVLKQQIQAEESKVDAESIANIRKMAGVSGLPIMSSKASDEVLQGYLDMLRKNNTPEPPKSEPVQSTPEPETDELPFM